MVDLKSGQDVFVPWVMSQQNTKKNVDKMIAKSGRRHNSCNAASAGPSHDQTGEIFITHTTDEPQIFNRYYHMFAKGELVQLVHDAASDLGLYVGPRTNGVMPSGERGLEIVQDGWERSNYYVELQCWTS